MAENKITKQKDHMKLTNIAIASVAFATLAEAQWRNRRVWGRYANLSSENEEREEEQMPI